MKTLGIILAVFTVVFNIHTADARDLSPGTIMITGDTSFDDSTLKMDTSYANIKTDTTTFDVTGAYFIATNFGVGLLIGNEDTTSHFDSSTTNSSINMIGPLIVYSISLNTDFNIVLGGGLYTVSGDLDEGGGNSYNFDGDGTFILVSVAYFLNDTVTLNFGFRRTDADIELKANYLANPPVSANMSDNANIIGFSFFF